MKTFDVQVLGDGIVGRSLALALARDGCSVALRSSAATARSVDVRAYALNAKSVDLLRGLKVWDALPAHAATAVLDMQVHGDAPHAQLDFSAWQQHVPALAWITDAAVLEQQLAVAVRFSPHITVMDDSAAAVQAPLTALCEGKLSATRAALGVVFNQHDTGHTAIAARLTSAQPHQGVARQWFRAPDVLALLPFDAPEPGHSHALVWSLPHKKARELMALEAAEFENQLTAATLKSIAGPPQDDFTPSGGLMQGSRFGGASHHVVGDLKLASPRAAWPLLQAQAQHWCGPGWVLLGDAAHVVHPLAGQGLNLGLADVAALAQTLLAREPWRELGDEKLLRRYARQRLAPTWAMGQVTGGLLQLFAHPAPAVQHLRNQGMNWVNRLSPLKRWLTQRALDS
jgi:ubiquinone biosynthesis UbiH/UbiF/VisC/COQ6 family hydroxylase